jgi:hypothetical protein
VQQFISMLTQIPILANGSLSLISHPSQSGIANDTGESGTTQWHNSVRARSFMKTIKPENGEPLDTDARELVFKKNNYGPISESIVLRYQNGLFLPVPGIRTRRRISFCVRPTPSLSGYCVAHTIGKAVVATTFADHRKMLRRATLFGVARVWW